jgi:hypothetical protein
MIITANEIRSGEPTPLLVTDRCDRCCAQAYVRAILKSGGELLFCGHHYNENKLRLLPLLENVLDDTSKLLTLATV